MAIIRPFAGIRYSTKIGKNLSSVIAPHYDVLDGRQKQAFLAKNPNNIVAIDLPHVPPKQLAPPGVYESAAKVMDMTAFAMCREQKLPVIIFNMATKDAIAKVVRGERMGTKVVP